MKRLRVNRQIRIPQVVLIDENNNNLGTIDTYEALKMAEERGFDLVEVNPKARPSVCKLLDYGSYQYQQEKQERKARARQKKTEVKGIRLSFRIGKHDLEIRRKNAEKFLSQGHKVKIEILLRGREIAHKDMALEMINNFVKDLGENVVADQALTRQGKKFFTVIYRKK
ncbi:MAG: translation initiation factor IF-3 [Candidatus Bathyarchaeota archaeon]|nr:translation initiation factor IF-3 [Candidatus Bathyarchaeota archaeon]